MIMIKVKQVVITKETMKQVMIVKIKNNDNNDNNDKE